jgi:hypothetical protein
MSGGRPRRKTPVAVVYRTHSDQFMVHPDALGAQDTFTQVSYNKRIGLFKRFKIGHRVKVCFTESQVSRQLPQLAAVALTA